MGKYKSKRYWNYRVVTESIPQITGLYERVFSIVEVFYDKNGNPDSYAEAKELFHNCDSVKSLKWIRKEMKNAFKKPILDLNNFPNEFLPSERL